jgi:hypothetical protein
MQNSNFICCLIVPPSFCYKNPLCNVHIEGEEHNKEFRAELKISLSGAQISSRAELSGVQSLGSLDINFTVGTFCKRAAPLAEKNAATRHHVLRSLMSLHIEHRVVYYYFNYYFVLILLKRIKLIC